MPSSDTISSSRSCPRSKVAKTRRSRTFWIKALKEFSDSGLGVQHFCNLKKLAPSSFYAWQKRLQVDEDHAPAEPARFIPIDIVPPLSSANILKETPQTQKKLSLSLHPPDREKRGQDSGLILHLNDIHKISIDKKFHGPTLQRLVKVLTLGVSLEC